MAKTSVRSAQATSVRILRTRRFQDTFRHTLIFVVLTIMGIIMVMPFVWMIGLSFDLSAAVSIPFPPRLIPAKPTLISYSGAIEQMNLLRVYLNTILVIAGVLVVLLSAGLMAGYGLSKLRFKGHRIVLIILLSTLMLPLEVRILPLFMIFKTFHMIDTYWPFWLPAAGNAYLIFLMKQYMDSVPDSLREAGIIDGAGEWWVFLRIFVPLSGNVVVTVIILQFRSTWDSLLWPLIVLSKPSLFTIQIMLDTLKSQFASMSPSTQPYPSMTMAGNVLSILPVLVIFLLLQRYIVQSVAMSGLKQ